MTANALRVCDVSKRFGRHLVLDGVSFDVGAGELVALVGENGAGKTTLVRCVAGLTHQDRGEITVDGDGPSRVGDRLSVVWQDLALCDNLDVVSNLFLGRELGPLLMSEAEMYTRTTELLASLDIHIDDLRRVTGQLSGGQRQGVAIARALLHQPRLLILDEPTSALGVAETASVVRMIRKLRHEGVAMLLVSHNLDQVFDLADRIVVLRHGRVVADVATSEVHPDDVVALITGAATDSAARKQLHQLRSLVDQLAEVRPSASLPLIVSALSAALGVHQLCVHLVESDAEPSVSAGGRAVSPVAAVHLVRRAAVGLPAVLAALLDELPLGPTGGLPGMAGARGEAVVGEDMRLDPSALAIRMVAAGVLSAWAIPVVGATGLLGVVSAYADRVGAPSDPQLELARLYANLAGSAIEREQLLDEVTRRNHILESLRSMLDRLAGPTPADEDLGVALLPLCVGIGAEAVAIFDTAATPTSIRAATTAQGQPLLGALAAEMAYAAELVGKLGTEDVRAQRIGHAMVGVPVSLPAGMGALVAVWADGDHVANDVTYDLLADAARTLGLAIERQSMDEARKESSALRRSNVLQRDFLLRLSHELRTPLTAIHGYASTLRQTDVRWDEQTTADFLERIASESARMSRLVADLLDTSVIETANLRLQPDWCDVELIVAQAFSVVPELHDIVADVTGPIPAVWADHDRLEQVVVNLLDNAVRHGAPPVSVAVGFADHRVTIDVIDCGPGLAPGAAERMFEPYVTGDRSSGTGLGLAIVHGIVAAHSGSIDVERTSETVPRTVVRIRLPVEPAL